MDEVVTCSYGDHPLQKVKVWNYDAENLNTYIYIHGGAWRDASNTFDELEPVAELNRESTFFGINYRLSPEIKHPLHLIDIGNALFYIATKFKVGKLHLLGYSVGATMILQLFRYFDIIEQGFLALKITNDFEKVTKEVERYMASTQKREFKSMVKTGKLSFTSVKFLDGIYDASSLIKEYPSYSSFILDAFPSINCAKSSISLPSLLTKENLFENKFINENTKLIICQSLEDDLLSMNQTKHLIDFLVSKQLGFSLHTGNWGKHDDIYGDQRNKVFVGDSVILCYTKS
ncbi:BNA7 [Candida oxycetoniae]|uniref:Kynurenine formamidase n=1 Tax=Candida oxycetoniae TaxID=497107 RepID=A0AAI9SUF3_9ASCO|nr:BNA7 [Candida oxycetoniae]KAI3403228.2 BNA7 [Candida oxycetoniae]